MKLDLLIELRDSPGQLSAALATISRFGGNVMSVLHEHGKRKGDWVPVRIVLDAPKDSHAPLVKALSEESRLLSVSGASTSVPYAFLLLGHVFESRVQDITDAVFASGAEVRRFSSEIVGKEAPSAALVEIAAPDKETLEKARRSVQQIAKTKGLTYVERVGGDDA